MKSLKILLITFILVSTSLFAQREFLTYYQLNNYQQAAPGAFKYGLYGFDNPALLNYVRDMDLMYSMDFSNKNLETFDNFGFFTGTPGFGFGMIQNVVGNNLIDDYRLSFGFGDRNFSLGIGYGWSNGAEKFYNRKSVMMYGCLIRPFEKLSVGLTYTNAIDGKDEQYVADFAVRPFKEVLLTLFGDYAMFDNDNFDKGAWSAGVSYEFMDGIRINARYFESEAINIGIDLSLGHSGYSSLMAFNKNGGKMEATSSNFTIRSGAFDRTLFGGISSKRNYLVLNLSGSIKYQEGKFLGFFKQDAITLIDVLNALENAKNDESIGGVIINASQLGANREMLWEVREMLREIREKNKKVIVFIERADIDLYHFASVSDNIVMDELGGISLNGYIMGNSYYKKMLDDVGIGVEELRYFKYKSAAESLVREGMSDADREQRQEIVNDWYETTKSEICKSRGFTAEQFESFVNDKISYLPSEALDKKLVDKLGRWHNLNEIVKQLDPNFGRMVSAGIISPLNKPIDDKWSEPDKIAIIYAVGVCAMDEGIKARSLVRYVKAAAENPAIKAIVLRVDSPGGDAMASDYIAEVVKKYKDNKPIIISQGYYAASGGYWLSMDGTKIVSSPVTITGSIGVIGTWMYNKGIKDDLGISTDKVKVGKYADLGFPFSLPLIGIGLPDRNLNEDEKTQIESSIKGMYKEFVTKVSEGRKKSFDDIEKIAQGRVWSGSDALGLGLVDEIGGMSRAIEIAKQEAGIKPGQEITVVQYPSEMELGFQDMLPGLIGVDIKKIDDNLKLLKFILEKNGNAMTMLPLDFLNYIPEDK
jgi:protease IV